MIRVAFLTSDNREESKDYGNPWPKMGYAPGALLKGLETLTGELEVHVVSCLQRPTAFPEKIGENIWYHGLVVPKIGWLRTGYQGCVRATRRRLRSIRPDVVHGQGVERDCSLCAVLSGFPSVITVHGNMRTIARVKRARPFSFHWLAARLERFTIPRSDGVICITSYTRRLVEDLARETWLVPNAVDRQFFGAEPKPAKPPICLCIGAICARKNQNAFIKALDPLAKEKEIRLIFLGGADREDPYCAEFFRLVEGRPWCKYAGFESGYQNLKPFLEEATLLALPSIEDNCPMVVIEAMAAGVPVAASNVGGVPDLVDDGNTGLLFDPLNDAKMRDAVERLSSDPSFAQLLAKNAKRRATERFHPTVVARSHVQIYASISEQARGRK